MSQLEQIQEVEHRMLNAMLTSDVTEIDTLLADDLLATGPDGRLINKADDLAAVQSGLLQVNRMEPLESTVKLLSDSAIVYKLIDMQGLIDNQPFDGLYRFTRVWSNQSGNWQVIAAHISPLLN